MLRFIDSFSHYTTITQKWPASVAASNPRTIVGSGGRFSGDCLRTNQSAGVRRTIDAQQTWILGVAVKFNSGYPTDTDKPILSLLDSGSQQFDVRITTTGFLRVTRNGTTLATSATSPPVGVWNYIELKVKIASGTSGTYEVHWNGVQLADLTSAAANTQATGNATGNQIGVGPYTDSGYTNSIDFCDFYGCDAQGSVNNDFLGDMRVEYRAPNGNGTTSGFTGSDGNSVDNYLLVDEHPPNDDTDYVEANPSTTKDTYAFQDLSSSSGTVAGVQIGLYARKTDAGLKTIQSVARLSGTEVNSADKALAASYAYYLDVRETKPGGGAWAISDVNSAEFGEYVSA